MPRSNLDGVALLLTWALGLAGAGLAEAGELAPIAVPSAPRPQDPEHSSAPQALRLEVLIRGTSIHLVEPFSLLQDGRLLARQADLEDIGIRVPGYGDPRSLVDLDSLPHVTHRYDPARQTINFVLSDADRLARVYDANRPNPGLPTSRSDWGTALNYSLFGTTVDQLHSFPQFEGLNATLDGRVFGPYGTLEQTMIAGNTVTSGRDTLRLDTSYTYSDPGSMMTGTIGDVIAGGLPWTRPFRFGGLQIRRDFGVRPDLVTQPLPSLSGSAAVPSTVDFFVNGVKAYSQNVAAGPYSITNLPVVSGNGTAHVLVTDASGQQTATSLPLFTTPGLLAPGLTDFSLDTGFARRSYGTASDYYGSRPLGSATARHGVADWLTIEGHAEGGAGLANAGLGAAGRLGSYGTLSGALSGSYRSSAGGGQLYLAYAVDVAGVTLSAASQRTVAAFADIGSITASATQNSAEASATATRYAAGVYTLDANAPRALDRMTVGAPLLIDPTSISVSLVNLVEATGTRSRIASASLVRPLPCEASLFATAYVDLARKDSAGLFVGLSMPLGERVRANVGGTSSSAGRYSDVEVSQSLDNAQGSVGWRLRDVEGGEGVREGSASYRSGYGTLEADLSQQGHQISGRGGLDGSVGYVAGGGFFVGGHASDGFAVVDTGAPNVPVTQDNRLVGTSNPWGKLLVSDLRPYGDNRIAIDPSALPFNAEAASTRQAIAPPAHGGVGVSFGVDRTVDAALVTFVMTDGTPVRAGSHGRTGDSGESFVVGYDGQAYVRHLHTDNSVLIDLGDDDCRAEFAYQSEGTKRVAIGPVPCR